MHSIRSVLSAFANLASALNSLATVIDLAAGHLRQSIAVGMEAPAPPGEVIDSEPELSPSTKRGRKAS
jgi:hypothetical protein